MSKMIFKKWREASRRYRRYNMLCNEVRKIAYKYQEIWPEHVIKGIECYFQHGEGVLALEDILTWLYESRIEPTENDRQLLTEMADIEKSFNRDYLIFWPDSQGDIAPLVTDIKIARAALLSCMAQLLEKKQSHRGLFRL